MKEREQCDPSTPPLWLVYYSKPVRFWCLIQSKHKSSLFLSTAVVCTVPIMDLDWCDERSDVTNYVDLLRGVRCTVTHRIIKGLKRTTNHVLTSLCFPNSQLISSHSCRNQLSSILSLSLSISFPFFFILFP